MDRDKDRRRETRMEKERGKVYKGAVGIEEDTQKKVREIKRKRYRHIDRKERMRDLLGR